MINGGESEVPMEYNTSPPLSGTSIEVHVLVLVAMYIHVYVDKCTDQCVFSVTVFTLVMLMHVAHIRLQSVLMHI